MAAPDILRRSRIASLVSGKNRESMGTPESTSERRGVLWMLLSIVFFSANVLLLRGVSLHAPAADGWVASAYRGWVGLLIVGVRLPMPVVAGGVGAFLFREGVGPELDGARRVGVGSGVRGGGPDRHDVWVPAAFSGAGFLDPDVDAGGDGVGRDAVFRGTIESAGSRRRRGDAGGDVAGGAAGVGSERGRCEGVNAKKGSGGLATATGSSPRYSPLLFVGSLGTPAFPLRAPCSADRPLRRIHPLHWMV